MKMGSRTPSAPLLRAPSDPIRRKNIPDLGEADFGPRVGSRVILCHTMPRTVSSPPDIHSRKGLTAARSIQHIPPGWKPTAFHANISVRGRDNLLGAFT